MVSIVAAGVRAIGMALVLSPAGWVVLIGAAVLVGFTAATAMDNLTQDGSGWAYDRLRGRR